MNLALAARNPEFLRQLWLEISPARLLGMPAVLALIFAAVGLADLGALPGVASTGFVLLVWIYGARCASSALLDEVAEATWDAQRLSSLTPWQLTWGKLAGGTLYAWYGGALCLAVWGAATVGLGRPLVLASAAGLVAAGVALQALALIAALVTTGRGAAAPARRGGAWWIVLLVALPFIGRSPFQDDGAVLLWWGLGFGAGAFWAGCAVVFAAWAVLGAQRLMAAALQVPLRPLAWLGFLLWLALFAAGFWSEGGALWRIALAASVVAIAAAYVALAIEPPTLGRWRRCVAAWGSEAALPRLPLMASALALALLAAALATLLTPQRAGAALGLLGAGLPLTWALLALRDLALACAVHWGPRARRAESTTVVLLVVLNLVLPWLLRAAGLTLLAAWLQPIGQGDVGGWLGVASAAAQAALALFVARLRWRAVNRGAPP